MFSTTSTITAITISTLIILYLLMYCIVFININQKSPVQYTYIHYHSVEIKKIAIWPFSGWQK